MGRVTLLATTVPGLEFIVAEEVGEICRGAEATFSAMTGRVFLQVEEGCVPRLMGSARSIEGVRLVVGEAGDKGELVERLLDFLRSLDLEGVRFAVSAERVTKEAPFTSLDIAHEIGDHIRRELHLEVSIDLPDVPVYVEYERGMYRFGLDLSYFRGLRDRPYRVFVHPSALNPIIAYSMCRLARPFRTVLDPFCGSGTIPLECLQGFASEAYCCDVNPRYVMGAAYNARAVGDYHRLHVVAADVRRSPLNCCVDAIVTNPPFGIREKPVGSLPQVYSDLFAVAQRVLSEEGKVVIVTAALRTAERAAARAGFEVVREIPILEGGLRSHVLVFRPAANRAGRSAG